MALSNEGGMTLRQLISELRKQYREYDVLDAPVFLYDAPAGENFTIRSVSTTDEGEVAIEKGRPAWVDPTWNVDSVRGGDGGNAGNWTQPG